MKVFQIWNNFSIRLKFFTGFLVIVLLAGFSMLILNMQLLHVVHDNEKVVNRSVPNLTTQLQVKSTIMERINYVMLYITTGNKEFLAKFEEASQRARGIENQLKEMALPHEKEGIERFIIHSEDWEIILRNQVIPVYQRNNPKDAMETLNARAHPIALKLMNEVEQLSQEKVREISHDNKAVLEDAWTSVQIGYIIIGGTLLLAILFAFYMSRGMTNPILSLLHGVRNMTKGDFTSRVSVANQDELGELSDAFNQMSVSIARLVEELRQTNKRLQEETIRAQESTRLKSEFLANMSHELRTPLTGIIGFAELLYEEADGMLSPSQRNFTQNIIKSGEHLLSMINDILDLTKIEAGKYELELAPFDMVELVRTTLTMLEAKAKQNDIELVMNTSCDMCEMIADETRIRQVLLNLLGNAIKFSHPHSTVQVKVKRRKEWVTVQVIDQGIGIEESKLDKIFDQFYQNDGRLERKYEGTGLGLSLSRQLVELHGGKIEVESRIHEGSIFSFYLPYHQHEAKMGQVRPMEGKAESFLLLYMGDFVEKLPNFCDKLQKNSIPFLSFMVESKQKAIEIIKRHPKQKIVVAAHVFHPLYVEVLEIIREYTQEKIIAYVERPLRLVERGQIMRVADRILPPVEEDEDGLRI
jgi:signal transduction histidine kinase